MASASIRDYHASDEPSWLRCRVLAFLHTAYFDDVWTSKPRIRRPGFELVTVDDGAVVGILDPDIEGHDATIDTIAVHPDYQRQGLGNAMLHRARERCRELGATTLDAWTRDDEATLRWYRRAGFTESDHYLHVYADHYVSPSEPANAIEGPRPELRPIKLFLHARMEHERSCGSSSSAYTPAAGSPKRCNGAAMFAGRISTAAARP